MVVLQQIACERYWRIMVPPQLPIASNNAVNTRQSPVRTMMKMVKAEKGGKGKRVPLE